MKKIEVSGKEVIKHGEDFGLFCIERSSADIYELNKDNKLVKIEE